MSDSFEGFTLWFTGLSGAGKSTLANMVAEQLRERGHRVEILDGDEVRTNLSKGLGFSKEDRDTNIRRIGYVAKLLARNGVIAITAAISPYRDIRDEVRSMHDRFFEVFVRCPLDTLVERDVKGLYKKALAGEIKSFTGVSDPYEEPLSAELVIESHLEPPQASLQRLLDTLEARAFIARNGRPR
jgi:adenylylsulfate kinase